MVTFEELMAEADAGWCFDCNRPLVIAPLPTPLPEISAARS